MLQLSDAYAHAHSQGVPGLKQRNCLTIRHLFTVKITTVKHSGMTRVYLPGSVDGAWNVVE